MTCDGSRKIPVIGGLGEAVRIARGGEAQDSFPDPLGLRKRMRSYRDCPGCENCICKGCRGTGIEYYRTTASGRERVNCVDCHGTGMMEVKPRSTRSLEASDEDNNHPRHCEL